MNEFLKVVDEMKIGRTLQLLPKWVKTLSGFKSNKGLIELYNKSYGMRKT